MISKNETRCRVVWVCSVVSDSVGLDWIEG